MQTNSSIAPKVVLDPVEIAGVGRRRDKLDVVGGRVGADLGGPVAGEAVLDPVEANVAGIGEPEQLHEGEGRVVVAARPGSDPHEPSRTLPVSGQTF